jgi:hypothetical protein
MNTSDRDCRIFYGEEARRLAVQAGTTSDGCANAYAAILIAPGVVVADTFEFAGTINGSAFRKSCDSSIPCFGDSIEAGGRQFMIVTSPHVARIGGAVGKFIAIVIYPLEGQTTPDLKITNVHL